jgi:ribosome recycling factor
MKSDESFSKEELIRINSPPLTQNARSSSIKDIHNAEGTCFNGP